MKLLIASVIALIATTCIGTIIPIAQENHRRILDIDQIAKTCDSDSNNNGSNIIALDADYADDK